ncbi:MAG: hypothetical protein M3Z03_00055 [Actinomycetota bacterium]|nr:hypothetical protein [Actinomycetota bacterium]
MTPIAAMTRYTVRTAVPPKRWFLALIPCGMAVLFGLLARGFDASAAHDFARVAARGLFALILPVASLVIGDAVLGGELRRGTFAFTWMSPVSAAEIAFARWAGGSIVATACIAPAFALSAIVAGAPGSAPYAALAGAAGAATYIAVFMAIGSIANRAAAWSLAFVFIVERLLGEALSGIAQLSPSWEARAAFVGLADAPSALVQRGIPHGWAAIVRLAIITAVALVITTRRLPRVKIAGSSD